MIDNKLFLLYLSDWGLGVGTVRVVPFATVVSVKQKPGLVSVASSGGTIVEGIVTGTY